MKDAVVDNSTLWCLLLYSTRYALHRASTAPYDVANWVRRYADHLHPWQVEQLAEEVATELRIAEFKGELVGHQCDHDVWTKLVRDLRSSG